MAIIIEELGIFGLLFITVGYGIIIFRLFRYAFKTSFVPYKIILSGAAVYLGAHFMLNVGGVSALLPLTGVPLLFISNGGSALVSAFIMMGLCQHVIAKINTKELAKLDQKTAE